jgi:hypothetical protein
LVERILTQHPDAGKQGTNIDRRKDDMIRRAILEAIREHGEITFQGLTHVVRERVQQRFEGSVTWYVTTVKLDLEARGLIERVPRSRPQRIHLASPKDGQA